MNRSILWTAVSVLGAAIVALMLYSLDRTAWLFALYEAGRPHAAQLGLLAAVVIELAGIALIVGESAAETLPEPTNKQVGAWVSRGLVGILATQATANFIAGFLRGTSTFYNAFGGYEGRWLWAIAGVAWFLSNALIPGLIFVLSKIEAHLIRLLLAPSSSPVMVSVPLHAPVITDLPSLPELAHPVAALPEPDQQEQPDVAQDAQPWQVRAVQLRMAGASWQEVSNAVGKSIGSVRNAVSKAGAA